MSLDKSWSDSLSHYETIYNEIGEILKYKDTNLPVDFDEPVTEKQLKALQAWETRLRLKVDDLNNYVDDICPSEHLTVLKVEAPEPTLNDVIKEIADHSRRP